MNAVRQIFNRIADEKVNRAYLSLGSNLEPEHNLRRAVRSLTQHGSVRAVSTVWESAPWGTPVIRREDHGNYYNAAVLLYTPLSAQQLIRETIYPIETDLGRIREKRNKNAPRTIDIDIMLFNHDILHVDTRQIPHPEILERPFVAVTLAEIDPLYVHPETGQTLEDIAGRLKTSGVEIHQRHEIELLPPHLR